MAKKVFLLVPALTIGGPKTVITSGANGLLVPIKDANALCNAINHMLADEEAAARMGESASEIRELIHVQKIVDQWVDYIGKVIDRK